jgi:hypothetical protein
VPEIDPWSMPVYFREKLFEIEHIATVSFIVGFGSCEEYREF